jgi:hypothetical protein
MLVMRTTKHPACSLGKLISTKQTLGLDLALPRSKPKPKGYMLWCRMEMHPSAWGASAFCARELLVENYGKHLANSNRSMPLSESRARNLSSPVFVVWQ